VDATGSGGERGQGAAGFPRTALDYLRLRKIRRGKSVLNIVEVLLTGWQSA